MEMFIDPIAFRVDFSSPTAASETNRKFEKMLEIFQHCGSPSGELNKYLDLIWNKRYWSLFQDLYVPGRHTAKTSKLLQVIAAQTPKLPIRESNVNCDVSPDELYTPEEECCIKSVVGAYFEDASAETPLLYTFAAEIERSLTYNDRVILLENINGEKETSEIIEEFCNEADAISYPDFVNKVLASWPKNKNSGDAFKDAFQQYFGHEKQGAKNSFEFTREFIGDIARADKKNLSEQVTKESLIYKICLRIRKNVSDANKELNDTPFDNNCKDGTAFNRLSQSMTPREKESWRHYHVSGGARIHYHLYKREGEPPRIVFKHFYPESEHFD